MKSRILFREPSLSECHASCSDFCRYYQLCPPPPSPSPVPYESPSDIPQNPENSENPESTPVRIHSSSHLVPVLPIAASAFAASLLLIFLSILALLHLRRRRRRRNLPLVVNPNFNDVEFNPDDGVIDHHVWYIRTTGLDQSAIESITAWEYKAGDGIVGAGVSDCAVCLGEFRDGELLRLLPKCGHAFHVTCIDTWLRSHVNCPLCRAPVIVARIGSSRRAVNEAPSPLTQPDSSLEMAQSDGSGVRIEIGGEGSEIGIGRDVGSDVVPMHRSASMNSIPLALSIDGGGYKCESKDDGDCKSDGSLGNGWKGHARAKSLIFPL